MRHLARILSATDQPDSKAGEVCLERRYLDLSWSNVRWPLFFLLSMSLTGLKFPLGYLFVAIILINRFREDKYDFIIMLTLFFGGYGLTGQDTFGPLKMPDVALAVSLIALFVYRKTGLVRKACIGWALYLAGILILASFSEESMSVQLRTIRNYLTFIYFLIPLVVFSGMEFDFDKFTAKLFPFALILCTFYIIDGFILNGFVFLPRTSIAGAESESTFFNPIMHPLSGPLVRKYAPGLYMMLLCVYPLAKTYKLRWWQWLLFIGALAACRTFTVILGFVIGYFVCVLTWRTMLKYALIAVCAFGALYYVDGLIPTKDAHESALRIKSSIDQIIELGEVQDDVDLADFGSGRFGQMLPKLEMAREYDRQLTGLGFLHAELTTNTKYILINEYYINAEKSEETAVGVEIEPVQVYINMGYLGLALYFAYFIAMYVIVRRKRYSLYFLSLLVMSFVDGLGAYGGLTVPVGLLLCALCFAVVIMGPDNKYDENNTK